MRTAASECAFVQTSDWAIVVEDKDKGVTFHYGLSRFHSVSGIANEFHNS